MPLKVAVVGAGWTGASCARTLVDEGCAVEIFEKTSVVGGHSRADSLRDVVYEPNGAHIFHTDDEEVARFVGRFGMGRRYEHKVLTLVHLDDRDDPVLLSWPLQVDELERLTLWPTIRAELDNLPPQPSGESLEEYAISLMGQTLYRLFIYGYSVKHWGQDPRFLSSSIAPKRIDLRTDGDRRLFRDRYQFFEPTGCNEVIERMVAAITLNSGTSIGLSDVVEAGHTFDAWMITAPLDDLVGRPGELDWRGIEMRSRYVAVDDPDGTVTAGYVVNFPDLRYPFTRTVETKHATGQLAPGTVVSEEYPGAPSRHYPIPTVDRRFERSNDALKLFVRDEAPVPVYFCGRLANYQYINQDQAVRQGIDCARTVLSSRRSSP